MVTSLARIRAAHERRLEELNGESVQAVPVRSFAQRFYCEEQVRLDAEVDSPTTPEQEVERVLRDRLTSWKPHFDIDQTWDVIQMSEAVRLPQFDVSAWFDGVLLHGTIDYVEFVHRRPTVLLSLTVRNEPNFAPPDHVELWACARLLDEMGFDTADLTMGTLIVDSHVPISEIPFDELPRIGDLARDVTDSWSIPTPFGVAHIRPFDWTDSFDSSNPNPFPTSLRQAWRWGLAGVNGARNPTRPRSKAKCWNCDHFYAGCDASPARWEMGTSRLASDCPYCEADLRETWAEGGCTRCGFYFDADHVSDDRRRELDRLRDEFEDA